jgi:hypothetical protein
MPKDPFETPLVQYLLLPLMLYIYPMWDSEAERIGVQKCMPMGSVLRTIAELLGFIAGIGLVGGLIFCFKIWYGVICVSVAIGLIGRVFYTAAQWLAARRGFKYDYETGVASWDENGERVTYGLTSQEKK